MENNEIKRIASGLRSDFKCDSKTIVDFCDSIIKIIENPVKMSAESVAKWLEDVATDEEFAETFVYLDKIGSVPMEERETGDIEGLTEVDMRSADVDKICNWIKISLEEILFSDETCTTAWWKQEDWHIQKDKDEGEYRIYSRQTDKCTGKCIGTMVSVDSYETVEDAKKDAGVFEIETDTFKQEVVAISKINPFEGGECNE